MVNYDWDFSKPALLHWPDEYEFGGWKFVPLKDQQMLVQITPPSPLSLSEWDGVVALARTINKQAAEIERQAARIRELEKPRRDW